MTRIYLAGWLFTLFVLCITPIPRRTAAADAATSVMLLVWPLVWAVAVVSAIIQMRDGQHR